MAEVRLSNVTVQYNGKTAIEDFSFIYRMASVSLYWGLPLAVRPLS